MLRYLVPILLLLSSVPQTETYPFELIHNAAPLDSDVETFTTYVNTFGAFARSEALQGDNEWDLLFSSPPTTNPFPIEMEQSTINPDLYYFWDAYGNLNSKNLITGQNGSIFTNFGNDFTWVIGGALSEEHEKIFFLEQIIVPPQKPGESYSLEYNVWSLENEEIVHLLNIPAQQDFQLIHLEYVEETESLYTWELYQHGLMRIDLAQGELISERGDNPVGSSGYRWFSHGYTSNNEGIVVSRFYFQEGNGSISALTSNGTTYFCGEVVAIPQLNIPGATRLGCVDQRVAPVGDIFFSGEDFLPEIGLNSIGTRPDLECQGIVTEINNDLTFKLQDLPPSSNPTMLLIGQGYTLDSFGALGTYTDWLYLSPNIRRIDASISSPTTGEWTFSTTFDELTHILPAEFRQNFELLDGMSFGPTITVQAAYYDEGHEQYHFTNPLRITLLPK